MDNGKIISCFSTFEDIQDFCFMFQLEINAPKQYACFFETRISGSKKTGKLFLNKGQRINYIQRLNYFAYRLE